MSTLIRRGLALAVILMAVPGVAHAAGTAVKAVSTCCFGHCPLG
ncbi:MAG TPA: hypothetical protein VGQ33_17925 [Vicinamibacteria bacterium]|nr:hypothetical protein [Vicinamibacteria bacterium]